MPVRNEQAGDNESAAVQSDQEWSPGSAGAVPQDASQAKRKAQHQQPAANKVSDLHPAHVAETEQAHGVTAKLEARTGHGLEQHDTQEYRPSDHAAGQ